MDRGSWVPSLTALLAFFLLLGANVFGTYQAYDRFYVGLSSPKAFALTFKRPEGEQPLWERAIRPPGWQGRYTVRGVGFFTYHLRCSAVAACAKARQAYLQRHGWPLWPWALPIVPLILAFALAPRGRQSDPAWPDPQQIRKAEVPERKVFYFFKEKPAGGGLYLGLYNPDDPGAIFREDPKRFVRFQLPREVKTRHVLVVAGTGAGKTTTYALNAIFSAAEAGEGAIVFDQKWGESHGLIESIAIYLSKGLPVYVFTPFSEGSPRIPLLKGIPTDNPTGAMEFAQMVVPAADDASVQHYRENDWALLAALVIAEIEHAKAEGRPADLGNVVMALSEKTKDEMKAMCEISDIASVLASKIFSRPAAKLDEAIPGLRNKLLPFIDPRLRRATTEGAPEENLNLTEIFSKPALLYVGIPESQIRMESGKVLLRVLKHYIDRSIAAVAARQGGSLRVHYNFILDEFANFGPLPNIDTNLATIRSKNVSMHIILQAWQQGEKVYGKTAWDATTRNNLTTEIWYVRDLSPDSMMELEERIGYHRVWSKGYSESRSSPWDLIPRLSRHERMEKHPILPKRTMEQAKQGSIVARIPGIGWIPLRTTILKDPRNPFRQDYFSALRGLGEYLHLLKAKRALYRVPSPKSIAITAGEEGAQSKPKRKKEHPFVEFVHLLLRNGAPISVQRDPTMAINRVFLVKAPTEGVPQRLIDEKLLSVDSRNGTVSITSKGVRLIMELHRELEQAHVITETFESLWTNRGIVLLRDVQRNPELLENEKVQAVWDEAGKHFYLRPGVLDQYTEPVPAQELPKPLQGEWRKIRTGPMAYGLVGKRTIQNLYRDIYAAKAQLEAFA